MNAQQRKYKIELVMVWMDVDSGVAESYLESEDWIVWEACQSIKGDRKAGLLAA